MNIRHLARCLLAWSLGLLAGPVWAQSMDWPLHDLNLAKTRYAALDQINTSNVDKLAVAWSFNLGDRVSRATPLVIDGVMYVNTKSKLFALNAASGAVLWSAPIGSANGPNEGDTDFNRRGPTYGDGRLYFAAGDIVSAVDAKTGKALASFGDKGVLALVAKALEAKYPGKYKAASPLSLGYQLTSAATYYNGTLYVGAGQGDNHVRGGLLIAVDGTTGAIRWVFSMIPQGPEDEGWEIAGPTWRGGAMAGGGIWTTPAIDPELGLIYVNAGNPSPSYDGSARKGINLFTNAMVALHVATGKLAWYFQALHHEIWDLDVVNGPVIVDGTVAGRPVKGVAAAGKTCYLYVVDRQTGKPINPIVETAVSTKTDLPGEEVWPTQPIPYTARGTPQQPFCAILPQVTDPMLLPRVRPMFTPLSSKELLIVSPGAGGGVSRGATSFSPKTGFIYVAGLSSAQSSMITSLGDNGVQGPGSKPFYVSRGPEAPTGMTPRLSLTAYDPMTGVAAWYAELPAESSQGRAGNLVTAGDLVFQGTPAGTLHAFDARSGRQQWVWKAPAEGVGITADPLTYQVNGKQYVSVVATNNTVMTFAVP